jgi:hypothetical protein
MITMISSAFCPWLTERRAANAEAMIRISISSAAHLV